MSYILKGFGRHSYVAPITNQGIGIKVLDFPGGIVIAEVQSAYIVWDAGSYPTLARVICDLLNAWTVLASRWRVKGALVEARAESMATTDVDNWTLGLGEYDRAFDEAFD